MADQFVCVRLVKCNNLDLKLFQFDFDLTFAVFFLNADRTIYARYGTRTSHDSAETDVSLDGLAATMKAVLTLHQKYPNNKKSLADKQPRKLQVDVPEQLPTLTRFKAELDYSNKVSKSCIHCHQVRDALRDDYRARNEPLPENLLFPYPSPDLLGIELETDSRATLRDVAEQSLAGKAGLRAGDELLTANGQPICSIADLQWVLHHLDSSAKLDLLFRRDEDIMLSTVSLAEGWRTAGDISWRTTTWPLRRDVCGGMVLNTLEDSQRKRWDIDPRKMALRVSHVGKYGRHAVAMRAGIRKGDVVVSYDGRNDLMTETDVIAYGVQKLKRNAQVEIGLLRNGKPMTVKIRLQ